MSEYIPNGSKLLYSDVRGIYIPRDFSREIDRSAIISKDTKRVIETLERLHNTIEISESDTYWEDWQYILDNVLLKEGDRLYRLEQDGDLWMIPE